MITERIQLTEFSKIWFSKMQNKWKLESYGCGCCSSDSDLTPKNLDELIKEHVETLDELLKFREELGWTKPD